MEITTALKKNYNIFNDKFATKLCKRYVLQHIEEFCDTDSLNQIETIYFWDDLWYWMDFQIEYISWNADWYSYKQNVLPKIVIYY